MSADDDSFHPLGKQWEDELEGMLDETEYDSDLGMQMAQDAMAVTKGDLSEAEFHEKYHDDVMEEFGVDDRPTEEAYEKAMEEGKGTVSRMLESFEGDGEDSRRDAMKKMGVGAAAAVGLSAWGAADDGPSMNMGAAEKGGSAVDTSGTQYGMVLDLERCDGCLSCVTACQQENNLDQGVNWMYILEYEDQNKDSSDGPLSRNRLIRPCQHCTDAPCEKVCPTTARHTRDKDGLVLTDYDVCIGCRYCQVACPYGVNYFQWEEPDASIDDVKDTAEQMGATNDHLYDERDRWVDSRAPRGVMSKCTFCPTRQDGFSGEDKVGTTACEDACPPNAIQFGDVNDPESDPQQYLANIAVSRARSQVGGQSPDRDDVRESYDYLDETIGLLDLDYLIGTWSIDEVEAALFTQAEISDDDLSLDDEELRSALVDILEEEFDEELTDEDIETLVDVLLGEAAESEVDSDDLDRATDAMDTVIDETESNAQTEAEETVDRYESREITPAEVQESIDIIEGEDEPWVTEAGITDEGMAQQVLESYIGGESSTFKLLEDVGTNPNVTYIGNEPGPSAEQVDGPVAYSDVGLTDNRKEVLDEGTVGDTGWSI